MPCVCARLEFVMEFVEPKFTEYARVQYRYISREL